MQPTREQLQRMKQIELDMLKAFISCCELLKLDYYLIGGTALGAVRHGGFIPWDDDIDVGMRRRDYEIFVKYGQQYLPNYYFIQTRETDPAILINYAKIRDSRTTFIESSQKKFAINHGIFIDIFPLDYFPEDTNRQLEIKKQLRQLNLRIRQEYTLPKGNRDSILKEIGRTLAGELLKLKYKDIKRVLEIKEAIITSCSNGTFLVNYSGAYGEKEVIQDEWLGQGSEAKFEGETVIIPSMYDTYLTHIYGDYMKLPAEEKRVSHHYTEVIDTERSYINYL